MVKNVTKAKGDGETVYRVHLSIASRSLTDKELRIKLVNYMRANYKETGELAFERGHDSVKLTYAAKGKKTKKEKKETPVTPPSEPTEPSTPAEPTTGIPVEPIDYMVAKAEVIDDETTKSCHCILNEADGMFLDENLEWVKDFNPKTCQYKNRYFADKQVTAHKIKVAGE